MESEKTNNYEGNIVHVSGMYKSWFLDYASYVILERAVPHINDGLKPVQRRILHSLKELHDGRYHKVANVIGHTMKYHPHGDTSIGDAMVQLGQKNLLLDMQGNWGNIATGDRAAASRYIEVRLTQFALDVVYNKNITNWLPSYDGRSKEPETLPIKFPLLLVHGVEGIAVGLSTKILPHNFNELIDASIKVLKGITPKIYPDFNTGGMADFTNYNDGKRGGKVRVRARILQKDKSTLNITELPFSTTTTSLISSILKANDKGKIKIKKVEDNTAEKVEICITLPSGISPDKTIDALYRFTDCEVSISPLSCVIRDDKPQFLGVAEILKKSTDHTLTLLKSELEYKLEELEIKWHYLSLEIIFIQNRVYYEIEELDNWQDIIDTIFDALKPFLNKMRREVNEDDIIRLTDIKIKKITKFDLNKAKKDLVSLEDRIEEIKDYLSNLTNFAVNFFKDLKKRYGKNQHRKTEIKTFENIDATKVVVASKKLYLNSEDGFIGTAMRKDQYICDCSDIDDIIVFRDNGTMQVVKVDNKVFVGKDIIHCAVFKKKDDRTIYNMVYKDGQSKRTFMKRFAVTSITRGKEYQLTKSAEGSKVLYFTANSNGEAEKITVNLRKLQKLKTLKINIDFANLLIKSKTSVGNLVTKNPVKNIELKSVGISTLSARKIWFDDNVQRLNVEERGVFLGEFKAEDKVLTINQRAEIELKSFEISNHFDDDILVVEKFITNKPISVVYYDGFKKSYFIKRFKINDKITKFNFINAHRDSFLEVVSTDWRPRIEIIFVKERGKKRKVKVIEIDSFISIKGQKAAGNKLSSSPIKEINLLEPLPFEDTLPTSKDSDNVLSESHNEVDQRKDSTGQITLEL